MTSTLAGTLSHGITLTSGGAYTAPFTITQTGALTGAAYSNLSGQSSPFLENLGFDESVVFANGGTVQNAGTISNAGLGYGILMRQGDGSVTNTNPGSVIYGGNYGIAILQGTGYISNAGSIAGLAGAAVEIATGTIINQAGAAIYAPEFGVKILNNGGNIQNAGAITGEQYGISMNGGAAYNTGPGAIITGKLGGLFDFSADATIDNSGTITQTASPFGTGVRLYGGTLINTGFIYGATGIQVANAATIYNAGTIAAARTAVYFAGAEPSRLIVAPGAVFKGGVTGAQGAANTLELTAGKGTLSSLGVNFSGFNTIALDARANWKINGLATAFANDTISGFTPTDQLDIAGLAVSSTSFLTLSDGYVLNIPEPSGYYLALTFSATNAGATFELASDGHGGGLLNVLSAPASASNAITLQPSQYAVTLSSVTKAFGIVGTYAMRTGNSLTAEAIGAAVFDPAGTDLTIINTSRIQSNAKAPYDAGVVLADASTFINAGTVIGATGIEALGAAPGAYIASSDLVRATIGSGIYMQASGTALNSGNLSAANMGIRLAHGGSAFNTGAITARTGIYAYGAGSYIYNGGQIYAGANAISMPGSGIAVNAGNIQAGGTGITLAGGAAYNRGVISATNGIMISGGGADAQNSGDIYSTKNGICLTAFGAVSNTGAIQAGTNGIALKAGGIAYNFGEISGATGIAVSNGGTIIEYGYLSGSNFAASFSSNPSNLFVMNAAARITGKVSGGGGELELTSGYTAGTIALNQFKNFSQLQVDNNANWDVSGNFSTGVVLSNNGTINLTKSARGTFTGGIGGDGTIVLSSKPLTFASYVVASQQVAFAGAGETLDLADPADFGGSIANFSAGDTIDIDGVSLADVTGTAFANNVLTISETYGALELSFSNSASLDGDVFLLTQTGAGFAITLGNQSMSVMKPAAATTESTASAIPDFTAAPPTPSTPTFITQSSAPGFLAAFDTPSTSAPVLITLQS